MAESYRRGKYGRYLTAIMAVSDIVIFNLAFLASLLLTPVDIHGAWLKVAWLLMNVAYVPVAYWRRHTTRRRSIFMEHVLANALVAVGVHALFFLAMLWFLDITNMPWITVVTFYGIALVSLPLWWITSRLIVKHYRKRGRNFVRVAIVGTGETSRRLYEQLNGDEAYGYRVLGFFGESPKKNLPGKYLGTIDRLTTDIKELNLDEVFYTLSGEDVEAMSLVTKLTDDNMVKLYYVPQIPRFIPRNFVLDHIGSMPILSQLRNPLRNTLNRGVKRAFDILFSGTFLLLSPLIFIPVAIAIKLSSPGPVFFVQERTGYRGRSFKCWKFRTMRVNAQADDMQATRDDPRKTKLGDFLRKTSIDELPQFINVFLGDMSVVGPRPHMLKHTEIYTELIDKYMVRHVVKPGITGWAQVNGYRGITDALWKMERRVEYDVWYIENWSLPLDLKIIGRTVLNAVSGEKNAF